MIDFTGHEIGRYHILEPLGEGGMAVVYKAYDTHLECEVAIKFIRTERFAAETSPKTLKRFKAEAQKMAQMSFPNIVGVTDFGEFNGSPYLVMRYLAGGTLKQKLGEPIPYPEAARLLAPIARALEYAHSQGVIHRDVKPGNILLTATGQPMLTDFGIAKILVTDETMDMTGTGVGIGTPEYMAPEQALGQPVDGRTDVYALGVVLYELVTGRKPFRADTPMAVVVKHVHDPLPRPKEFVRELPESVERVLFKALAKKPADRYADMGAFALELEKLAVGAQKQPSGSRPAPVQGRPSKTKPAGGLQRISGWAVAGVLGSVLILATIFGGVAFLLSMNPDNGQKVTASRTPRPAATREWTATPDGAERTATAFAGLGPAEFENYQKLYLRQNFESSPSGLWEPWPPKWQVVVDGIGNPVLLAERPDGSVRNGSELGAENWDNYRLHLRFKLAVIGSSTLYLGLRTTHTQDAAGNDRSAQYALDLNPDGQVYFNKRPMGKQDTTLKTIPLTIPPGIWHDLDVLAHGATLVAALDGKEFLRYSDTSSEPLLNGRIVVETWDSKSIDFETNTGGAAQVWIDDLEVYFPGSASD